MTTPAAHPLMLVGSGQQRPFTPRRLGLCLAAGFLAVASLSAAAQTVSPEAAANAVIESKTERIIHHDRGSRIEEVRVGGQTRSIQVDTNSQVPGYQVQPIDPAQSIQDKGSAGKSSWRIIKF